MTETAQATLMRIQALSKTMGVNTELMLTRWVMERFLNRLARSDVADRFVLKGALLFAVWEGDWLRSTSDLDLEGLDEDDAGDALEIVKSVAETNPDVFDGVEFAADGATALPLLGTRILGERVLVPVSIGQAKLRLKVDVAFGHPLTPGLEHRWYPSLLPPYESTPVSCCPRETMVAEKLATAVEFGKDNSRLRDYFDLWFLSSRHCFQGHVLFDAACATFSSRDAAAFLVRKDGYWQAAFEPVFASPSKEKAWRNWGAMHAPQLGPPTLSNVVAHLQGFAVPLLEAVRGTGKPPGKWVPGRGWSAMTELSRRKSTGPIS